MTDLAPVPGNAPGLSIAEAATTEFDAVDVSELLSALGPDWGPAIARRTRIAAHIVRKTKAEMVEMASGEPEACAMMLEELDALTATIEGTQEIASAAVARMFIAMAAAQVDAVEGKGANASTL